MQIEYLNKIFRLKGFQVIQVSILYFCSAYYAPVEILKLLSDIFCTYILIQAIIYVLVPFSAFFFFFLKFYDQLMYKIYEILVKGIFFVVVVIPLLRDYIYYIL